MNNRLRFAARIRQKGFFTHFPVEDLENEGYIKLWRSVLDIALGDLIKGKENLTYRKVNEEEIVEKGWQELIDWFNPDNYDFQIVCGFSEFNPEKVHQIMSYCVDNADEIKREDKWNDIIRNTLVTNLSLKGL